MHDAVRDWLAVGLYVVILMFYTAALWLLAVGSYRLASVV